ncbi:MAG TPA: lipopolysaccharide heptosyltransferase II, partial [Gammaproteobacteria bacterium]|nr:lipopolysaccharide heptosyltransferase II [Gammaproteobacteria bacterium]
MVMAQSLFRLVKQRHPGVQIDVLAPFWSLPLLHRMPEVHEALDLPFKHGQLKLAARYRLARSLRDRGYDQAIVLPNSLKSALIPFWAKIPVRTGYVGEWRWGLLNDIRRLDKTRLPMTVQRFVALGMEDGDPLPAELPYPRLAVTDGGVEIALTRL